jgi:CHAD domain-containing protein
LLTRRTTALLRQLPRAIEGDAQALHRSRIASRRLRELLPLLDGPAKKAGRRVRKVTRILGRVRELDVSLQLLDENAGGEGIPRAAVAEARQQVWAVRDERRDEMLRRLQKLNLKKLSRRLEETAAGIDAGAARVARQRLAARLARRSVRLHEAMSGAGAIYVAARLHAVRLAAKKLRYALEIAAELGTRGAARLASVVRRAQVTLGHLQDRTVLLQHVQEAAAVVQDPSTRDGLIALAAQIEEACRELHGQYLGQRDALEAALAAARRDIVPEITRAGKGRPLRASLRAARGAAPKTARR